MQPFTLLIKPSGSDCNLDCKYCFYKSRSPSIGRGRQRMSVEVLEKLVKDYMSLRFGMSAFAWQGGEPMLMGLDFYKEVVRLQEKYGGDGQEVSNALQTNGIMIDEEWSHFLRERRFLVGISVDGPKRFHDHFRLDFTGGGTHDKVMKAIENCRKFDVEFNTLTLLNRFNADYPEEVLDFLVDNGVRFLQFIPCVELDPDTGKVTDFSITPEQYGNFLCRAFDRWCEIGLENLSIRDFESILSFCVAGKHTICTFDKQCSGYIVVEHKGDCYCCDFFVEPKWYIGNILEMPIEKIAASSKKRAFGRLKGNLCNKCVVCRHLALCRGGCMKDRVPFDKNNFGRESYFCESYKQFFDYALPRFMQIAATISARQRQQQRPQV
ncbi:MAG: anaerobic sulfatase maturase [Planctomycetota bacterium]